MTKMEKRRRMMGTVTAITTELSSPPATCEDSADFRKPEKYRYCRKSLMHFRNLGRLRDFLFFPTLNNSYRGLPRYICNLVFFTFIEICIERLS